MSTSKKPVIGVTPLMDYERESMWMLPAYFEGIEQAGGVPFMLPSVADEESIGLLLSMCDGLLITGGQDVAGDLYGVEDPGELALIKDAAPERDAQERILIPMAAEREIPMLGICRGEQIINVVFGGTLWQDLATQNPSEIKHPNTKPYDEPKHKVTVLDNTPLASCVGAGELAVNSFHHQAVRDVAPELAPMAISEDGVVEAVYHPGKNFLWGVQWHPEFMYKRDEASRKIFEALISATVPQKLIWV